MDYQTFEIEIRSSEEGVEANLRLAGTAQERSAQLKLEQLQEMANPVLQRLVQSMRCRALRLDGQASESAMTTHVAEDAGEIQEASIDLRPLGDALFDALASSLPLAEHHDLVRKGSGQGLRIRLIIEPKLNDVASLPWEMLYREDTGDFLGRCWLTPISISIPGPIPAERIVVKPPLRVLAIGPDPDSDSIQLQALDLAGERSLIRNELRRHPAMDVDFVEPPTFDRLIEKLSEDEFHVLHFMGHSYFDPEDNSGCLFFEDEGGGEDAVSGQVIGDHLRCYPSIRLVVLNSCSSGRMPRRRGADPFSGVATALLQAGLPAVVAMRLGISDRSAIQFSQAFYQALANGDAVDVAAAHGRLAMFRKAPPLSEWAIPTVFMQVPDGEIQIEGKMPVRLGVRSLQGYDADMEKRGVEPLDLLDHFQERRIKDAKGWNSILMPKLKAFLEQSRVEGWGVHLELAAHQSLAFAAGYLLEAKSGYELSVRQRGLGQIRNWRCDDPVDDDALMWLPLEEQQLQRDEASGSTAALAVAISLTKEISSDVQAFVEQHPELAIGSLLDARLPGGAGQRSVGGGAHANQLAVALVHRLEAWQREHPQGTIHLFAAVPNGFFVFLGRLARALRSLQLYEYDFDHQQSERYSPSLSFPPTREPAP